MRKAKEKTLPVNVALLVLCVGGMALSGYAAFEITNALWIAALLLFVVVPKLFYQRQYGRFAAAYAGLLAAGIVNMELIIESDGSFGELFRWWTWQHELPELLWPTLFVALAKVATDLTLRQELILVMERQRNESEIRSLKLQLSPHVLFNNLNNIYSFALHRSKETPDLIIRLADVMRYMLYEAQQEVVPLAKEVRYLDNYVELQRKQLEDRLTLIYDKKGPTEGLTVAPLILISFVENCFKHAAATDDGQVKVIIQLEVDGHTLNLFTENAFARQPAADGERTLQEGGVGLKNVRRRLKLLYPNRHHLLVKEINHLYIVNLSVDLATAP